MAKQAPIEAVVEALGKIKYPGYNTDILSLGLLEDIQQKADGGIALVIRQASERDQVVQQIALAIHEQIAHELGVNNVELKVHRIEPELGEKTGRVRLESARYIIAVASGKGGVGKSTVAANLAVALSQLGHEVGLLDADIYGPSVPMMFDTMEERPRSADGKTFTPIEKYGLKLMSIGYFLSDKAPIIWRGPMVMGAVRQFLKDTAWGALDFLVVDLPPGTGDAQLTLAQQVSLDGAVIVTTPQDVATLDAMRAIRMFRQLHCPILGIVENMSYYVCPDCGERDEIFGGGGGEKMAKEEHLSVMAKLPIYEEVRVAGDSGAPITIANRAHPASETFREIAKEIASRMSLQ